VAATRTPRPSGCPAAHQTARAVPGSCRQPPVAGPTSGRSRGRSITLAGTAVPAVGVQHARARMYALRVGARLRSEATVTGQVGPDRRRTTHPRSPARAHHRAGLGGTGAFERTRQDDAEAWLHRLFIPPIRIGRFRAWCAEQGKGPANARAGYSASLARRQGPVAYRGVAAHPHAGSNSRAQHVACIQSAEGQLRGPEDQQRTWLPAGWLRTTARDMKPCRDGPAASAEPGARCLRGR